MGAAALLEGVGAGAAPQGDRRGLALIGGGAAARGTTIALEFAGKRERACIAVPGTVEGAQSPAVLGSEGDGRVHEGAVAVRIAPELARLRRLRVRRRAAKAPRTGEIRVRRTRDATRAPCAAPLPTFDLQREDTVELPARRSELAKP